MLKLICFLEIEWQMTDQTAQMRNFVCTFVICIPGFPQALEIMENLENLKKKFHAWKNHGICKNWIVMEKSWNFVK